MKYNRLRRIRNSCITRLWTAVLISGVIVLFVHLDSAALTMAWGEAYSSGSGVVIPYTITNDDAGTSYSFVNDESSQRMVKAIFAGQDLYASQSEMLSSGQLSNNIYNNSEVISGWDASIDAEGNATQTQATPGRGVDDFESGQELYGYFYLDGPLVENTGYTAESFQLSENTDNAVTTAYDGGIEFQTAASYVQSVPEPTSMALLALGIAALGNSTNCISLNVALTPFYPNSTNLRFQVATTTNLSTGTWTTNSTLHSITGAVTTVTITNNQPSAFFKVIKQ